MVNILIILIVNLFTQTSHGSFKPDKTIIYVQPIDSVNPVSIEIVRETIEKFYGFKCVINPTVKSTNNILAVSKTRLDALKILKKYNSTKNTLILTEKDIATKKGKIAEFGVFGLGFRPGKVCVVSTFRLKRKTTQANYINRLKKITLHEVGHNLGLDHCNDSPFCLMNDAKGTVSQVDREKMWLCSSCLSKLKFAQ